MAMRHKIGILAACLALFMGCSDDQNLTREPVDVTPQDPNTPTPHNPETPTPQEPEPVVQDPIAAAIQYNERRLLPIRFILKLKQTLDIPIDRSSLAKAVAFDEATVKAVADLQTQWFDKSRDGRIDAETLLKIEDELFDEGGMKGLIGPQTIPDEVLISGLHQGQDEVEESVYLRCQEIIEQYGGYFDSSPGIRNMLAIRGAMIDGDKLRRMQSAKLYIDHIQDADSESTATVHFASGSALHPASGQIPFDDIMLTIWKEEDAGVMHYYVQVVPLNVDPGMQGGNGGYSFDGTAHLRDGQYIGVINRHSTSMFNHAHAVLQACYDDVANYDLLQPSASSNYISYEDLEKWLAKTELPRIQYTGINNIYNDHSYNGENISASGASEVIRDFRTKNNASDGIIDEAEWNLARKVLANLDPDDSLLQMIYPQLSLNDALFQWGKEQFVQYTDEECQYLFGLPASVFYADYYLDRPGLLENVLIRYRDTNADIAINIHTSPDDETSSQGCLNVPISNYPAFLNALMGSHQQNYLYTLVDASKIVKQ